MSNFKLLSPTIQKEATATSSETVSTDRPITNLFSGTRSDRFQLATQTRNTLTINYDLGSGNTKTATALAILRAKLLAGAGCTGVRLRASTVSGTTAHTATARWIPSRGATLVTGAISSLPDITGNGNTATQGTAANRPLLSRGDNRENRVVDSYLQAVATYWGGNRAAFQQATTISKNGIDLVFAKEDSTAANTHFVDIASTYRTLNTVSGQTYIIRFVGYSTNRSVSVMALTGFAGGYTTFDLLTGVITETAAEASNVSITAVGDGSYICQLTVTANASALAAYFQFYLNNPTGTRAYNGDNTSGVYLGDISFRHSSTSLLTTATTTYPQIAGINGNAVSVYNGTTNSLTTALAVNPTGGMYGGAVVRMNSIAAVQRILTAQKTAAERLAFFSDSSGRLTVSVRNGVVDFIGRRTAGSDIVANQVAVFSFTYDGGTASSGIKIYKNGTQIDTTNINGGAYTVPTAGDVLSIGGPDSSQYLNGSLGSTIFGQGSTWSDADRQAWEAEQISRYITAPIASVDFPATYNGGNEEDYLLEFVESSAFRHWWVDFVSESETIYPLAKLIFGKALDLGRDPVYPINLSRSKDNRWSRAAAYTADLNFEAISDTKKSELMDVLREPELALVALDSGDKIFRGALGLHCSAIDSNVSPFYGTENDISLTLKENI